MHQIFKDLNVSRETEEKLTIYHDLLVKWQKTINLVSPKTIPDAWTRHFADSAQIVPLVGENLKIADIGAGAGFPGLVLALLRPDLEIHLIESDERKCQFMKTVSRETKLENAHIHTARAENTLTELMPDMIMARALADLKALLDFSWPVAQENADLEMIFLKGANWREEVDSAGKTYDFTLEDYPSCSDPSARILKLASLQKCA